MVTKAEAALAFTTLWTFHTAHIGQGFDLIRLRHTSTNSFVHMGTCVYKGENYIPQSVRRIAEKPLSDLPSYFYSYLVIDEQSYQITLHHSSCFSGDDQYKFYESLQEFDYIACKWRDVFKEMEQEDLVYISCNKK